MKRKEQLSFDCFGVLCSATNYELWQFIIVKISIIIEIFSGSPTLQPNISVSIVGRVRALLSKPISSCVLLLFAFFIIIFLYSDLTNVWGGFGRRIESRGKFTGLKTSRARKTLHKEMQNFFNEFLFARHWKQQQKCPSSGRGVKGVSGKKYMPNVQESIKILCSRSLNVKKELSALLCCGVGVTAVPHHEVA